MTHIIVNSTKSPFAANIPASALSMALAGMLCGWIALGLSGCKSTSPVVCKDCIPNGCKAVVAADGRVYYVKLLPGEVAGTVQNGK